MVRVRSLFEPTHGKPARIASQAIPKEQRVRLESEFVRTFFMYAPSGAAAKVLTKPAKKLNHEVWKARMCGLANEKTLMAVALCSASTCARGTEEERHTNTEAAAQNEAYYT